MARLRASGKRQARPLRRLFYGALLAGAIALVALQTAPQIASVFDPARSAASDRLAGNEAPGLWAKISGSAAKDQKIRELEAEVRELARYKAAAVSMAERMESYEDLLNLLGEPPKRGVTARIIAENDGPFSETMLANAGRSQGVEEGAVAVNEGGLVGRVIGLGSRTSRVLLVNDFSSRIPVMGEISGLRAVMYGDRDGLGTLKDMPEDGKFVLGERILTTGEGGAFPRGIVAGDVVKSGGQFRVRFSKDGVRGGYVRMIPPPIIPVPEPVEEPASEPGASPAQGVR